MPIHIIRHAEAVAEQPGLIDEHRFLTRAGRDQARRLGQYLAAQQVALDTLYTSPLVRAVQTAELVAVGIGYAGAIEVLMDLAPGGDLRALAARIASAPHPMALVGHEPGLSALAGLLCGRSRFHPLDKAEAIRIEGGRAIWSLTPADPVPRPRE
jgi:phosphohistidine phosphatase